MSKLLLNTRQKILNKALEMFNERGIEYVGLRELAAILDMRVSNITYYFPTKDDLVFELSQELRKKNSEIIIARDSITIKDFLGMMHQVFKNHYEFRGLLRSFVHVMQQNKLVMASYLKTQESRGATIKDNICTLAANGYLKVKDDELNFLVSTLSLISRFWISDAAISFRNMSSDTQIRQYFSLITNLIHPYSTAKARKEIEAFQAAL